MRAVFLVAAMPRQEVFGREWQGLLSFAGRRPR